MNAREHASDRVKLASGGHATVWLVRSKSGELVAEKRLHPHLVDDAEVKNALRREAEIAMRLRHPNIVRLRSIELDEDAPVLVMDYVDGATLAELVRDWIKADRQDTARAAIRIVLDAAEGLHALHELRSERGEALDLVHRDVSPQNVLVGRDGTARVSDFGLAKALATDRPTTEGILKGKAGYLAPEYVRGERGDRRQDVFSLGVVAWEALARARLFRGESDMMTLEQVLSLPVPSLSDKAPELAAAAPLLDAVLGRALARDPDARFATTEAFAHALREAAATVGLLGTRDDVVASFSATRLDDLTKRTAALEMSQRPRRMAIGIAIAVGFAIATGAIAVASLRSGSTPPPAALVAEPAGSFAPSVPSVAAPTASQQPAPSSMPSTEVHALPDAIQPTRSPTTPPRVRPTRAAAPSGEPQVRPNPY